MKAIWLSKNNNPNLIVFFAGWGFDENPFRFLNAKNYDVLVIFDYNDLEIPKYLNKLSNYKSKYLIAWSMGVFTAFLLRDLFKNFDKKIAINGTVTPVDNEYGIPVKIFELTLEYAKESLEGKFYKNVFKNGEEYKKYLSMKVKRPIENRISELSNLYKFIKQSNFEYEKFYDFAIVSNYDKIVPCKNQIKSNSKNAIPLVELPLGHYPFYGFNDWDEIIKCK